MNTVPTVGTEHVAGLKAAIQACRLNNTDTVFLSFLLQVAERDEAQASGHSDHTLHLSLKLAKRLQHLLGIVVREMPYAAFIKLPLKVRAELEETIHMELPSIEAPAARLSTRTLTALQLGGDFLDIELAAASPAERAAFAALTITRGLYLDCGECPRTEGCKDHCAKAPNQNGGRV